MPRIQWDELRVFAVDLVGGEVLVHVYPVRKGRLLCLDVDEEIRVEIAFEDMAGGEAAKAVYLAKRGAEVYVTRDGYVHIYPRSEQCPPLNLHFRKDEATTGAVAAK